MLSVMLTEAAFNLYTKKLFYSCDCKAEFSASLLQCHKILQKSYLIWWFADQETFLIIINDENSCAAKNSIYLK